MSKILPSIGASGTWTVKAPFDTKLEAGVAYACKSIRKFSEMAASGVNVQSTFYDANNIAPSVYATDQQNDESIISLCSSAGVWEQIPSSFILGWPSGDTVPYVVMGILLNLGAIPNTVDPSFLTEKLTNLVKANLGQVPELKYVTLSKVVNKSYTDFTTLEAARQQAIADDTTDYTKLQQAQAALATANAQITALQNYIVSLGTVTTNTGSTTGSSGTTVTP